MGKTWGTFIAKGIAIAVLYGIAYLALRYISFNQWFLPAGLRAACLLFLPYRYWSFLILGEVGVTLSQKVAMIDHYGWLWAYGSSILHAPITAVAPYIVRKKLASKAAIMHWLPLAVLVMALWSTLTKSLLNHVLGGPLQPANLAAFGEFLLGDYLGILTVVLLALLVHLSWRERNEIGRYMCHAVLAAVFIGSLYWMIRHLPDENELRQLAMLMSMTTPAVLLTYYHGWKGAAIGSLLASVGIAQTMIYTNIKDVQSDVVLYAQLGLLLSSTIFLLLGGQITRHYEKAKASGFAESDALKLARMSLLSNEPAVRDQLIIMASMQVQMDDARDLLAKDLHANGKPREAMELHRRGVEHRQLFEMQALVVYPIAIERDGLFGVLDTDVFRESHASGLEVDFVFGRVDPRTLSEELQVSAYRCLCYAMNHLSDWEPTRYRLYLRAWHGRTRRGLYLSATIATEYERHATPHGESASLLLEARVKAHGGILRRSTHQIRVLLSEPVDVPPASQELPPAE